MARSHALDPLLKPRSIALVGASARADTPGNTMVRAVAVDGYGGRVYAINPNYEEVEGHACFPDLASLPEQVDHVVLGLGNEHLEAGMREAARHGAKAVTIFASCDLTGQAGDPLAHRLAALAREASIAVCGGNCMGFFNPQIGLRVSGYGTSLAMKPGSIAFITQSGSAFSALSYSDQRLKFCVNVSSGREMTTTMADYCDWALDQPATKVIGLFLETARDPQHFAQALQKADRLGIPVVALKVGRTELSAAFAASHSGAIAGNDAAYEALFAKWGVVTVKTLDQLAANLLLFSAGRPAGPGGLASMHDSGGEREMVVDLAADAGIRFADLCEQTLAHLRPHLDSGLQPANPLDVWGSGRDFEAHVEACMTALLDDPDTAIGVLFQDIRDHSYVAAGFVKAIVAASMKSAKPVAVVSNFSAVNHRGLALAATEAGVPVIDGTQEGLDAIRNLLAFRDRAARPLFRPPAERAAMRAHWRTRLGERQDLDESEGLALLADYGIAVPLMTRVDTVQAALAAAGEIGFPVALKTAMPGIRHKSDVAGVKLGIGDADALERAYMEMSARLGPAAIVAKMAPKGVEIAFGMIRDEQFGPYLIVASGGLWIEILKDRAVALPPLSLEEAGDLIGRLKIAPFLDGQRGMEPADKAALCDALMRFSWLAADLGDLIDEMDVNPLSLSARGCIALDALVIARKNIARKNLEGA